MSPHSPESRVRSPSTISFVEPMSVVPVALNVRAVPAANLIAPPPETLTFRIVTVPAVPPMVSV